MNPKQTTSKSQAAVTANKRDMESQEESYAAYTMEVNQGRKIAAVIGIDKYEHWSDLNNAVNDAQGVYDLFQSMEFETPIKPLLNDQATKKEIGELINQGLAQELGHNDSLVLFFAGHGHTHSSESENGDRRETGYLIPTEAGTNNPADYIPLEAFLKDISRLPARDILVVLDSCRSGFALGQFIELGSGEVMEAEKGRRIISAARKDQPAYDGGPIEFHSMFTGFLIQGLEWGTADLQEDGRVSSSELGLFLRKHVEQASRGEQTPDFGTFEKKQRRELVIPLEGETFFGLKTSAFTALQRGELEKFGELVERLGSLKPHSPWTLFLQYRQALLENQVEEALALIDELRTIDTRRAYLPLTSGELAGVHEHLDYYGEILKIPSRDPEDFSLQITLATGYNCEEMYQQDPEPDSLRTTYRIEPGQMARFDVTNNYDHVCFVYFLAIRPDGRMVLGPLLRDPTLALEGLYPGQMAEGSCFKVANVGLTETRIFCSSIQIADLLLPKTTATRMKEALKNWHMKHDLSSLSQTTIWYLVAEPLPEDPY